MATDQQSEETAELCVGELYRNEKGHEVWRIKEAETGRVLHDGIESDREYRWVLDAMNHGEQYADQQQARRDSKATASQE
jgi:hypothetical protein